VVTVTIKHILYLFYCNSRSPILFFV